MATAVESTTTVGIADDWEHIVADNDNYSVISLPISEDDAATDSSQGPQVTTSSESPLADQSKPLSEPPTINDPQPSEIGTEPHVDRAVERCGMDLKDVVHEPETPPTLSKMPIAIKTELERIATTISKLCNFTSHQYTSNNPDVRFVVLHNRMTRLAHIGNTYVRLYKGDMPPPVLPRGLVTLLNRLHPEMLEVETAQIWRLTSGPLLEKNLHTRLDDCISQLCGLMSVVESDYNEYKALHKAKLTSADKNHTTNRKTQDGATRGTALTDPVQHYPTHLSRELRGLRDQIVTCLSQIETCSYWGDFSKDQEPQIHVLTSSYRRIKGVLEQILAQAIDSQVCSLSPGAVGSVKLQVKQISDDMFRRHVYMRNRRSTSHPQYINKSTMDALRGTEQFLVSVFIAKTPSSSAQPRSPVH